ncbi:hypothetical protein J1605_012931 [Eschrichtius robustus]|uniref:Piezo TM1-24 domain-containing protein n=1 Tax=Eschrichtius robustus TaxID=9764 RepID=A0AB34GK37_ESCRO|nr:hypothetical protein J1605_012931 [Eschrichtius robustus]
MRHSYFPALNTMMAWRLSYTSWLGFVLLLWACVLWRSRSHRRLALQSSPFLVSYANLLVLRSQVLERWRPAEAKEEAWREDLGEASGPCSILVGILGSILKDLRVKYQICICASMFFAGKVVAYKVVYVLLFLSWVAWYQVDPAKTLTRAPVAFISGATQPDPQPDASTFALDMRAVPTHRWREIMRGWETRTEGEIDSQYLPDRSRNRQNSQCNSFHLSGRTPCLCFSAGNLTKGLHPLT